MVMFLFCFQKKSAKALTQTKNDLDEEESERVALAAAQKGRRTGFSSNDEG